MKKPLCTEQTVFDCCKVEQTLSLRIMMVCALSTFANQACLFETNFQDPFEKDRDAYFTPVSNAVAPSSFCVEVKKLDFGFLTKSGAGHVTIRF
jgi:hypothetical protein